MQFTSLTYENIGEVQEALAQPFPDEDIEWKIQAVFNRNNQLKAIVVPYLTNRAIQTRLDEVVGPFNWKNDYKEWRDKGVMCGIGIRFDGEWIFKFDGADETAVESTKGGFSAASKRAAVVWGIGRKQLYGLPTQYVDIFKDKPSGNVHFEYVNWRYTVNGQKNTNVSGYWIPPKISAITNVQGSQSHGNGNRNNDSTRGNNNIKETKVASNGLSIEDVREFARVYQEKLGLTQAQQIRVFQRVNPYTPISKAKDILSKAGIYELLRYNDLIEHPAKIKNLVDQSNADPSVVLDWLSEKCGEVFNSFASLITYANSKTVDAVTLKIKQLRAA